MFSTAALPARGDSQSSDSTLLRPFEVTTRKGHVRYVLVDDRSARDDAELYRVADELLLRSAQNGVLLVRFWSQPQWVPRRLPETCDGARHEVARIGINLRTGQRMLLKPQQFGERALSQLGCDARLWRPTAAADGF